MCRDCILRKVRPREKHFIFAAVLAVAFPVLFNTQIFAQQRNSSPEFTSYAMQLRENALLKISPHTIMSPSNRLLGANDFHSISGSYSFGGRSGWKTNITTTVFWVGEQATVNNPVANDKSAWDGGWRSSYGGYDDPKPPYNDVDNHHTRPEAAQVIPWFRNAFVRDGESVCKGRWLAIRHGDRVCYAQWEDVGPFATDHWQYVFGNERPRPNRNRDAGLDVSPAVRDYLGLAGLDVCDWKFADFRSVPPGPWAKYGDNNSFVRLRRQGVTSIASVPSSGSISR